MSDRTSETSKMFGTVEDANEQMGFWDQLGVDEGGLPRHLPMPVNADGQGPEDHDKAEEYVCWCNMGCPLDQALRKASELHAI